MNAQTQVVLCELRRRLESVYGDRLVRLLLYGSQARGDAEPGSDIDVLVVSMFALCLATLATNIAANVVSPANDFAHLWPKRISFRTGGLITGVVGILMQPWRLVADPTGYIFKWLVA